MKSFGALGSSRTKAVKILDWRSGPTEMRMSRMKMWCFGIHLESLMRPGPKVSFPMLIQEIVPLAVISGCSEALLVIRGTSLTHSCASDFPVMPSEKMTVSLKPTSFFELNPSNDVPRSSRQKNQATLAQPSTGFGSSGQVAADECCAPRL